MAQQDRRGGRRGRGRSGARQRASRGDSLVGATYDVEVGAVAHGGHCVARHEGRVVFVRHAIPGERARVVVTEGDTGSSFLRADVVEVLDASPERVVPPCPYAGSCGGCDFQHVDLAAQRRLKARVVTEQLARLAGLEVEVSVEQVPGADDGLGWRTRVQYAVDREGRVGLRRHRSRELVVLDQGPCRIAHPDLPEVADRSWPGTTGVESIRASGSDGTLVVHPAARGAGTRVEGPDRLTETVELTGGSRDFGLAARGFWQVHPGAAPTLAATVDAMAGVAAGDTVLDLYAGAGLLTVGLARAAGEQGSVVAVEGDATAAADARTNLADLGTVAVVAGSVESALGAAHVPDRADVVVLDPPRTGARREVVDAVAARSPRVVVHVACDPAALARDVALFSARGYALEQLRAFDLFPMTQHVECVARLVRHG